MFIINEKDVDKGNKISKWLIGPWNASIDEVELGVAEFNKGESFKAHFHLEVQEILYIIEGLIEIIVNDEKLNLSKGTAIYFEPNESHSLKVLSDYAKVLTVKSPSRPKDKFYI
ncbi:MAG: cupin domain-containing protein [Candidatus Helarchaeota archaeon]|nr:cupin domain-containing protein [Candidatus Helarchaeota archaeon]